MQRNPPKTQYKHWNSLDFTTTPHICSITYQQWLIYFDLFMNTFYAWMPGSLSFFLLSFHISDYVEKAAILWDVLTVTAGKETFFFSFTGEIIVWYYSLDLSLLFCSFEQKRDRTKYFIFPPFFIYFFITQSNCNQKITKLAKTAEDTLVYAADRLGYVHVYNMEEFDPEVKSPRG